MSEMIDRVARAIYANLWEGSGGMVYVGGTEDMSCVIIDGGVDLLELARAAIEAMRMAPPEPRKMLRGHPEEVMQTHEEVDEEMFRKKWNARIDEALK